VNDIDNIRTQNLYFDTILNYNLSEKHKRIERVYILTTQKGHDYGPKKRPI
jgi:hypothetical protein